MKIETAIKILNKEREFLGMTFFDLLFDIQKEGKFRRMVYSQKVIEAYDRFMVEIKSKILRVVQEKIFKTVFQAVAPNYTDQPEVALKHVYQIVTDKDGKKTCCLVQEYYTQILEAMQPVINESVTSQSMPPRSSNIIWTRRCTHSSSSTILPTMSLFCWTPFFN